ncbi:hypothetical protein D3C71_1281010 [compost metagenome]
MTESLPLACPVNLSRLVPIIRDALQDAGKESEYESKAEPYLRHNNRDLGP